jgi:hypothetical protein
VVVVGIVVAVVVVALVAVGVAAFVAMQRGKASSSGQGSVAQTTAREASVPSPSTQRRSERPVSSETVPMPGQFRGGHGPLGAAGPAASGDAELKMVSCEVDGKLHGAMPPFGKLTCDGQMLTFDAVSRVVALSGALASGDGASTMQSMGSIEMGKFRYELPLGEVAAVAYDGTRQAQLTCGGKTYAFEGLGPSAKLLHSWLAGHGIKA